MDNFTRSSKNMFVAQGLNRAHNRRKRAEWLLERINDPSSVFIPVWDSKVLVTDGAEPRPLMLKRPHVEPFWAGPDEAFFLGESDGCAFFAIEVKTPVGDPPALPGRFRDLRAVGPLLSKKDGALLAYAKMITYWHGRNRFCSVCGSPSASMEGGHVRACSNRDCLALHFPRTDPAIIVLIRFGEKCLLGRQPVWPERMYSVIAGFVEPGESAESAVVREAFEEAGVRVKEIYYQSSQPWPFPSSLMLAFTAEAEDERIRLGDKELEDARWFSREELRSMVEDGAIRLPSTISIAFQLIEGWFDAPGPVRLGEIAARGRIA